MGVGIKTFAGTPLTALLCDQLGIAMSYIEERVQTVFINYRAVDRLDAIIIQPSMIIALSAAMPGLAGATLRKGGMLAGFREGISHDPKSSTPVDGEEETIITLKLFNQVAEDLTPHLLEVGIWVQGRILQEALLHSELVAEIEEDSIQWNAKHLTIAQFKEILWPADWILLQVTSR